MDARIGWLLLGCAIGFIAGYIVRSLREIKEKVAEVDEHITKTKHWRNDNGLVRYPLLMDAVLLLVVAMTVWAAVTSQINSNQVEKAQARIDRTTECTRDYLAQTIVALNERTTYTQQGTDSNVALQQAFNKIVVLSLKVPPVNRVEGRKALIEYANALSHFLDVNQKSKVKVQQNPFPTNDEFQSCINRK